MHVRFVASDAEHSLNVAWFDLVGSLGIVVSVKVENLLLSSGLLLEVLGVASAHPAATEEAHTVFIVDCLSGLE